MNKRPEWEKYESRHFERDVGAMVSILKSGSMMFNRAAVEEFLSGYEYAILFYASNVNWVGIKPESGKVEGALKLSKKKDGSVALSAKGFLTKYKLLPRESTQYQPTREKIDRSLIIVRLDNPLGSST